MSDPKPVEAVDPAKKTSRISGPVSDEATVLMTGAEIKCHWNDEEFEPGDRISADGKCYECSTGLWVEVDG